MRAYIDGLRDLKSLGRVNRPARRRMFWLPLGVGLARASLRHEEAFSQRDLPKWDGLTDVERRALVLCWCLLESKRPDALDVAADWPFLLPLFKEFEHAVCALPGAAIDQPMPQSALTPLAQVSAYRAFCADQGQDKAQSLPHFHIARILERCLIQETLHGRRRGALPDPTGFNMSLLDATPDWMARHRDPQSWHVLVPFLIELSYVTHFAKQVLPTLEWVLAQPDCDLATAASAFVMLDGPRLTSLSAGKLDGERVIDGHAQETQRRALAIAIAERAAAGGYQRAELDFMGFDVPPDAGAAQGYPDALFARKPAGNPARSPFYLEDGTIQMALF